MNIMKDGKSGGWDIVLATINARYSHTAIGLRWLWANLGALRERAVVHEFTLDQPPLVVAERILAGQPRVVGLGVYIWNVSQATQVVEAIKGVRPETVVVIGGPEVSHEYEGTPLFANADYLVCGEGERAFAAIARAILDGRRPVEKVVPAAMLDLGSLELPYDGYTDEDIAQRQLYVEASRGCPFECEFCLSSLDTRVREFPLEPFLDALGRLIARGARRVNFVDRTFNLKPKRVEAILRFLLAHWREGFQAHFEIVPDRLPAGLLELLAAFPPAGLHLEVGVQSFDAHVQAEISRRQDLGRTLENLYALRTQTGALLHADLVAGLPGETWDSFADGFDRLVGLRPHEIQVGILKRLKGAPIARHIGPHAMAFSTAPPYEILQTDGLRFEQLQRIKRFARYFDLYYNADEFKEGLELLWRVAASPFNVFMRFSDYIWAATGRTHAFSLARQVQMLHDFLVQERAASPPEIARALERDFHRKPGRKDKLELKRCE